MKKINATEMRNVEGGKMGYYCKRCKKTIGSTKFSVGCHGIAYHWGSWNEKFVVWKWA